MAEPAAVLAIVNGLANTANICFQIIRRAYHAPDEIKHLNAEACNWRPQLEVSRDLLWGGMQDAIVSADIHERAWQSFWQATANLPTV